MIALRNEIELFAAEDAPILLTGETGTGKTLAARVIHDLSNRKNEPFRSIDCAGISGSLIESELFGHVRGAFTGAVSSRSGPFEEAGNGTIFLDEIGELPLDLQAKLLRVLSERVLVRVGGSREYVVNARVIAATNVDLEVAMREGRFRKDLYFRLEGLNIELPPLRDRRPDIPLLIDLCLEREAQRMNVEEPDLTDSFLAAAARYDWPGNVRELERKVTRLLLSHRGGTLDESSIADLIESRGGAQNRARLGLVPKPEPGGPWRQSPEEEALLREELSRTGGNIARMARHLGIARGTLRYRLSVYNLEPERD